MRTGYIVLILALFLAAWRYQTPTPAAANAPATVFSASRAFTDITALAQKPHPVGTAEHERVRELIVTRMNELGLAPVLQSERSTTLFRSLIVSAPVTNIIGTLKGKDQTQPAVLIMSHYDTVPDSPGAADDTAGVATTLEIARALKSGPQPQRDIIFLITDGEELGLMGASAFFHHDPLAAHVGAVINFETRGDSGLANMFETGPNNADAVALYAAEAKRPSANSLSRAIYKSMPNGTDLSVALEKGLPALNFAFIGDEAAYHTPLATPAHLDLGSVQHMGDQALGAARAFAARIPEQKADEVFSDILGFFMIQYPLWFGWVVFAAAAALALYGIWAAEKAAPAAWGRGIAAAPLSLALPVAVLIAAGKSFGGLDHFLRLAHVNFLLAGAGALVLGLALTIAALFTRRRFHPAAVWQVLLLLLVILGGVAQVLVPQAAFVLVWPVLVGGVMATVRFGMYHGEKEFLPLVICSILALVYLAMTLTLAAFLFTAVGVDLPVVLVLPLLTGLPILLLLPQSRKLSASVPLAIAAAGALLFAYGRYAGPTADRPAPALVRYVKDLDSGKAYRVAYLNALDPWTEEALGTPRQEALPWANGGKVWWSPADAVNVPDTDVILQRSGASLGIFVAPRPGAYSVVVSLRSEDKRAAFMFDGVKVPAAAAGTWHDIRYYAPGRDGFSWIVAAPTKGKIEVKVTTLYQAWPQDVAPLPLLPPERMAFGNTATTETIKRRVWTP